MNSGNSHLLELTIAGLNALTVHAEESLFWRSVGLHIGSVNSDLGDTVVGFEMMAQSFTDGATITKSNSTKLAMCMPNHRQQRCRAGRAKRVCWNADTIRDKMEFPAKQRSFW
jgi:hypothetical protein